MEPIDPYREYDYAGQNPYNTNGESSRQPYNYRTVPHHQSRQPYIPRVADSTTGHFNAQPYESQGPHYQPAEYYSTSTYPSNTHREQPRSHQSTPRYFETQESVRTQPGHDHFYAVNRGGGASSESANRSRYNERQNIAPAAGPSHYPNTYRSRPPAPYSARQDIGRRSPSPSPRDLPENAYHRRVNELGGSTSTSYQPPYRRGHSAPVSESARKYSTSSHAPYPSPHTPGGGLSRSTNSTNGNYGDSSFDTPTSKRSDRKFVVNLPAPDYISLSDPTLPATSKKNDIPQPKLLVLDMNGALVYRDRSDKRKSYPRPYLASFLEYLFFAEPITSEGSIQPRPWEVFVWSSAQPHNVQGMVESTFGDVFVKGVWTPEDTKEKKQRQARGEGRMLGVWARDKLGLTENDYRNKVQTVKDLRILSAHLIKDLPHKGKGALKDVRFDESNMVLLDDSPLKGVHQPWNEIILPEFAKPEHQASRMAAVKDEQDGETIPEGMDDALVCVVGILEEMRDIDNVPAWIRTGGLTPTLDSSGKVKSARPIPIDEPALDNLPSHHTFQHWHAIPDIRQYWLRKGKAALMRKGIELRHGLDSFSASSSSGVLSPRWSPVRTSQAGFSREMRDINGAMSMSSIGEPGADRPSRRHPSQPRAYSPSRPASSTPSPSPGPRSASPVKKLPKSARHITTSAPDRLELNENHPQRTKSSARGISQPNRLIPVDSVKWRTFKAQDVASYLFHASSNLRPLTDEQRESLQNAASILENLDSCPGSDDSEAFVDMDIGEAIVQDGEWCDSENVCMMEACERCADGRREGDLGSGSAELMPETLNLGLAEPEFVSFEEEGRPAAVPRKDKGKGKGKIVEERAVRHKPREHTRGQTRPTMLRLEEINSTQESRPGQIERQMKRERSGDDPVTFSDYYDTLHPPSHHNDASQPPPIVRPLPAKEHAKSLSHYLQVEKRKVATDPIIDEFYNIYDKLKVLLCALRKQPINEEAAQEIRNSRQALLTLQEEIRSMEVMTKANHRFLKAYPHLPGGLYLEKADALLSLHLGVPSEGQSDEDVAQAGFTTLLSHTTRKKPYPRAKAKAISEITRPNPNTPSPQKILVARRKKLNGALARVNCLRSMCLSPEDTDIMISEAKCRSGRSSKDRPDQVTSGLGESCEREKNGLFRRETKGELTLRILGQIYQDLRLDEPLSQPYHFQATPLSLRYAERFYALKPYPPSHSEPDMTAAMRLAILEGGELYTSRTYVAHTRQKVKDKNSAGTAAVGLEEEAEPSTAVTHPPARWWDEVGIPPAVAHYEGEDGEEANKSDGSISDTRPLPSHHPVNAEAGPSTIPLHKRPIYSPNLVDAIDSMCGPSEDSSRRTFLPSVDLILILGSVRSSEEQYRLDLQAATAVSRAAATRIGSASLAGDHRTSMLKRALSDVVSVSGVSNRNEGREARGSVRRDKGKKKQKVDAVESGAEIAQMAEMCATENSDISKGDVSQEEQSGGSSDFEILG